MIGAILSAILILGQSAPAAASGTGAPAAKPKADSVVSSVTVNGRKLQPLDQEPRLVVCENETVLGTLFPKRVCVTQENQNERRRDGQQLTRDIQRSVIVGEQPL